MKDECLEVPYSGLSSKPEINDIDNDGNIELITGISTGGFLHYKLSKLGDINSDNSLDILDVLAILNQILDYNFACHSDINHDSNIDVGDLIALLNISLDNTSTD